MNDPYCPWTAPEPLAEVSLWYDWDSVASMIAALRIYLFEYGTIPTWNFLVCGGRPELGTPFSWAFTWPSLFAYSLPPNHAIVAVWLVMTAVGFLAMQALLLRYTSDRLGAAVGACLWAVNGYFAARFNIGHVTFAFFHLVPVLMLVYEWSLAKLMAGQRAIGALAVSTLASFAFFTAALPHALLHLYGAFVLLVVLRTWQLARDAGLRSALRGSSLVVGANLLGLWLSAYKLWPVIRWQLDYPRWNVLREDYALTTVLGSTVDFVWDYYGAFWPEPWHVYPVMEYGAFIGPVPWLLAGFAVAALALRRRAVNALPIAFGLVLVVAGVWLSMGNANPATPGRWFAYLPMLEGVRIFPRYQILTILGLALLSAQAIAWLGRSTALRWTVAAAATGPALFQGGLLVWNVHAVPYAEILKLYEVSEPPSPPLLVGVQEKEVYSRTFHQTPLLEAGYWVKNCRGSMNLSIVPGPQPFDRWPLTTPAPLRVDALASGELTLAYAPGERGPVQLHVRVPETFELEPLAEDRALTLRAVYPGPRAGAYASLAGLLATGFFFGALVRRS